MICFAKTDRNKSVMCCHLCKFHCSHKFTFCIATLHKKWSFPLRISSVNVTKSAGKCLVQGNHLGTRTSLVQEKGTRKPSHWVSCISTLARNLTFPSRHTTSFHRLQDVYTTSETSYTHLVDVETTSCVYRVSASLNLKS